MQKAEEKEVLIGQSYYVIEMSVKGKETLKNYRRRVRNVLKAHRSWVKNPPGT